MSYTGSITAGSRHERCPHCHQTIRVDETGVHKPVVIVIDSATNHSAMVSSTILIERIFVNKKHVRALKLRDEREKWRRRR